MTENYITFEQAKLFKEKGFPQEIDCFYITENTKILSNWLDGDYDMPCGYYNIRDAQSDDIGKLVQKRTYTNKNFNYLDKQSFYEHDFRTNKYHNVAVCPTQSLAYKWLRDEKNIDFDINTHKGLKYKYYTVYMIENKEYILDSYGERIHFKSYEDAMSAGIDAALKLVKK